MPGLGEDRRGISGAASWLALMVCLVFADGSLGENASLASLSFVLLNLGVFF